MRRRQAVKVYEKQLVARLNFVRTQRHLVLERTERRSSQADLQVAIDRIPSIVGLWDENHRLRFANEEFTKLAGATIESLVGKSPDQIFGGKSPLGPAQIDQALSNRCHQYEHALEGEGGESKQVSVELIANQIDDEILGFFSMLTEIRSKSQANGKDHRELQRILDRIPASIAYWSPKLINQFANQTYLEWFGLEGIAVEGQHITKVIGEELYRKNYPRIKRCLAGQPQGFERSFKNHADEERVAIFRYLPDFRGEEVAGFFVLIFDITDRRRVESDLRESRRQLRTVLDNVPALIGYWNTDLQNEFANRGYADRFGADSEEIKGKHLSELMGKTLFEQNLPFIKLVLKGKPQTFDRTMIEPGGDVHHTQETYIPEFSKGKVCGFYSLAIDVTARREAELQLVEEKERARVTLGSIVDAVISTDCDHCITYMNPKAEEMTGWSAQEALGRSVGEVVRLYEGPGRMMVIDPVLHALIPKSTSRIGSECILVDRNGKEYGVEDSASSILDANGHAIGTVMVIHDVSETRAMSMRMTYLAQHDSLTNLPNRVLLQDRLQLAMARSARNGNHFALVFLDLDHFKNINDSMGHAVGDELLRSISTRLSGSLRTSDTVSRQGGDEFILLLEEVEDDDYVARAVQRILKSVSAPYQLRVGESEYKLNATFSAGIALYPEHGADADTLMRRADTAMYLAKQSGRNRYQFFANELDEAVMVRHVMLQDMRDAIDHGDFFAAYQPKISTSDREIVGVEALVRWQKQDGSIVSPADFIPLAEESGLIVEMGAQVLEQACIQCVKWESAGLKPITVAVNVSAVQLANPDFVHTVAETLKKTGIRAERLELEITESSIMADVNKAAQVLHQLRDLGVRVSLDDFGTGYSSLSYLRRFPLDCLKIDRSFVSDLTTNKSTAAIMETICNLGRTLQLEIVAEGVETEDQAELLCRYECNAMQGYLFSKPVSGQAIAEMLKNASKKAA